MSCNVAAGGNTALLDFHRSCSEEFLCILKEFNILFYGYGCKQALLESLFPGAMIFNLKLQDLGGIAEDLVLAGFHTRPSASIRDIDGWLGRSKKSLVLILVNFDFALRELQGLENIRIIGTLECIDFTFGLEEVRAFNFIFRDLTTFVDYADEVLDVEIKNDRAVAALMVLANVPRKAGLLFRELVSLGTCSVDALFDKVKRLLMLTKKAAMVDLLAEFVDHRIIKIKDNSTVVLNLNREERRRLLENDAVKQMGL